MGNLINRGMGAGFQQPVSMPTQGASTGMNFANSPVVGQIKQMMNMLNGAQNPQAILQQVSQQNPQLAQVMQMCNGRNPQEVFYQMCQQKGVNPDEILNALKS